MTHAQAIREYLVQLAPDPYGFRNTEESHMADLTTDPADPRLTRGVDSAPAPQAEAYLVLSAEELAKGYIRPLRRSYVHSNPDPTMKPDGCGTLTTMSLKIAQTYARDPKFYGGTYCCGCKMHLANEQFTWDCSDDVVGS